MICNEYGSLGPLLLHYTHCRLSLSLPRPSVWVYSPVILKEMDCVGAGTLGLRTSEGNADGEDITTQQVLISQLEV